MSVSASLDESSVTVEPGGEADLPVTVLNSGTTVEEFRFEVVGPCAAWTTVEPESLSLYPGASGTATLKLRPPRDHRVAPGETPLGLRVVPTSDAARAVVPERTVEVLAFTEVTSELVPRTSHSAWRGRHKVAVDSRGNTPVTVMLTAQESGGRARLLFEPAELDIPPGQAKFSTVTVRPAKRVWRGAPVTHPFQAVVAPKPVPGQDPHAPVVVDGSYEQQAILPRWLPRALIAACVLAGVLIGLWFAVLRPTVRSAAREAITPEAVESAIDKGKEGGSGGQKPGGGETGGNGGSGGAEGGANGGSGGGNGSGKPKPSDGSSAKPGEPGGPGAPTSARKQVKDAVGGGATTEPVIEVPEGKTFELTDIVVQNPQGDAGTVVVSSQDGQLLDLALENFRDSDYHFVTPIEVPAGGEITISVTCREVGKPVKAPAPAQCAESLFLGGTLRADDSADDA
ncbi:hypothetical protein [Streptomyces sp. XD-27]|uniref:COG1470 family protein n=1 Tax=Streptomyces sp. XD-27 TaxID=3062779 RepID=UPI0026F47127|nr:hypothetical protein [Streptomyces sp. XD-27]WKX68918.1 hypothetical protein Q3Y56_02385 [Streptomyces sp. XD-27]